VVGATAGRAIFIGVGGAASLSNQTKSNLRNLLQRPTTRALGRLLQQIKNKNTH